MTCLNLRGLSPLNISIPPMWSVWATISLAVLQLDETLYVSIKFYIKFYSSIDEEDEFNVSVVGSENGTSRRRHHKIAMAYNA